MRSIEYLALVGMLLTGVPGAMAQATVAPTRTGTVVVPERLTSPDANTASAALRPVRTERPDLPPAVKARIEKFKLDARTYLAQQEALKKQLQGASEEQRAALRQQLQALRQQWLEQARELRKETKDRLTELEKKLPDHRDLLDELRNNARDQRLQGSQGGSGGGRRGSD